MGVGQFKPTGQRLAPLGIVLWKVCIFSVGLASHVHLRRRGHHLHPGAAKGLPQQVGHAVGPFRTRQQHGQPLPCPHELAHAHGKKIARACKVCFRKGKALGLACGSRSVQGHHALHVTLRNAQKITPVAQVVCGGKGQVCQIFQRCQIKAIALQTSGIKCPAHGLRKRVAQKVHLHLRQPFWQLAAGCRTALPGQPRIQRAGAKIRISYGVHDSSPYRRVPLLAVRLCKQKGIMRPSGRTTWIQQPRTRSRSRLKAS